MERILISCLLNSPQFVPSISAKIKPEYFENKELGNIFKKMIELGSFSTPLLSKELNIPFNNLFEIEKMMSFASRTTTESYGYAVLEGYKTRAIQAIVNSGNLDFAKIEELRALQFFDYVEKNESEEFLATVQQQYANEPDDRLIPTGFYNVDSVIYGFRKTEAIFIGGRPGSGKTTFGMNVAYKMARDGKKVLFCSLEMASVELHARLVKSVTRINNFRNMSSDDFEEVIDTSKSIKNDLPLYIYDKPGMTIEDIVYKATEMAKSGGVDIVFIDHLAILKTVLNFRSRYEEVSYLSAQVKVLARKLDIPVVCMCQLNRGVESRDIKAPTMADLRDSGSIEENGDIIGFIYRPEYHLKNQEPDDVDSAEHIKWETEMQEVRGKAQFIIAKNRRGLTGKLRFEFDGANFSFYERSKKYE